MVRIAKFNEDSFIDAAIEIAANCGVPAVSISAIASKAGAPVGSVYHRFESRDTILARAWLKVKAHFRHKVASQWGDGDTWQAVSGFMGWCRDYPLYAQFLLQSENAPFLHDTVAPELHAQLEAEQAALDACFQQCMQKSGHELAHEQNESMLRYLLIDSPIAVVKPYLMQNRPIPTTIDAMLRASHDAVRLWATPTR
jgi:AcrR family transcriptional regulator